MGIWGLEADEMRERESCKRIKDGCGILRLAKQKTTDAVNRNMIFRNYMRNMAWVIGLKMVCIH